MEVPCDSVGGEVERLGEFLRRAELGPHESHGVPTYLLCYREHALHPSRSPIVVRARFDMLEDLPDKSRVVDRARPHRASYLRTSQHARAAANSRHGHTCKGELHSGHLLATGGPVRALKWRLTFPLFSWTFSIILPSGCSWNAWHHEQT